MMTTLEIVAAELLAADQARPRSQQTAPGASQAGSCRAALLLRTTGAEPTDVHLSFDMLVGTAIHAASESAASAGQLVEQAFTYRGVRCTVDRYDPAREVLTDLKSKASPEKITDVRESGPSVENVWQIMLGAAALIEAGHQVKTVELLYVPRSGGSVADCWLWSAPFSQGIADEAADWMQAERERADGFTAPAVFEDLHGLRDKEFWWCRTYCDFFSACRGVEALPTDDDYAEAAGRHLAAKRAEAAAKAAKREASKDLAGFTGRAGGFEVRQVAASSWTELDAAAITVREADWRLVTGEDLPAKRTGRSGYVEVKPVKA